MRINFTSFFISTVSCAFLLIGCRYTFVDIFQRFEDYRLIFGTRVILDTLFATLVHKFHKFNEKCVFTDNLVSALNTSLSQHIIGQDHGIKVIIDLFSAWDFHRSSGIHHPLILAITGPTGVGKSETAHRIGESLFKVSRYSGVAQKSTPCGLLILRGEDFSVASVHKLGLAEVQNNVVQPIVDLILHCAGQVVVVFDEVQKIAPEVLDILMPGLDGRDYIRVPYLKDNIRLHNFFVNSISKFEEYLFGTTYFARWIGSGSIKQHYIYTSNVVFVFISDIGADIMTKFLLSHGDRQNIPQNVLRNEMKQALDEQWIRLRFGKTINDVIPFLPLEPDHIVAILRAKITAMSNEMSLMKWHGLTVDEDVLQYLISPAFIKYSIHLSVKTGSESEDKKHTADSKIFATWGARAIENAGPLQDLRSMLQRFARPWRLNECLHIGMLKDKHRIEWGLVTQPQEQIYMQWCKMEWSDSNTVSCHTISDAISLSNYCETVWVGRFPS